MKPRLVRSLKTIGGNLVTECCIAAQSFLSLQVLVSSSSLPEAKAQVRFYTN
jgi:hypothetical protein